MHEELHAQLEKMVAEYERQAAEIRTAYARLREVEATATSKDGLVTVKAGQQSRITHIELDPRITRKLSASEIAASIMEQIEAATSEVSRQTTDLLAPLAPDGVDLEGLLGADADLGALLPSLRPEEPRDRRSGTMGG
ncbi:YbaB/EbfC family nucleoid-associated protein [Nonomuraea cavernae]|uniref:YbaB/EbfC family nucleoid-associated protein n=1 Tax=Nonomuraea cavernae TaxID=2045107 RepID=UPI0033D11C52